MHAPGVDIVVVNFKTPMDLDRFGQSVIANRPTLPHSVTIVNVCPEDADWDVTRHLMAANQTWQMIGKTENVGYGRACNAGAAVGDREVIAFFNADVAVTMGAVDACQRALMANPRWGVLGPRQVDDNNRMTHAGIFGTHVQPMIHGWQQLDDGTYSGIIEAISVSGSAYFIKRDCWDELARCETYRRSAPGAAGAFLPTPHYYEETWCSYHAAKHGWKVMYFGPVKMIHQFHRASPVGGWADRQTPISRALFRQACADHLIASD